MSGANDHSDQPSRSGPSSPEPPERVLERISDGFFALDDAWRFTYLNETAKDLIGCTDEVIGREVWDVYPEAVGTTFETEYRRAMESQTEVGFEAYFEPLEAWFEVRAYPAEDGLSVYFQDVTDRRSATERLNEHRQALQELYEITVDADSGFEEKVERLLELGRDYLGVADGVLVEVDPETDDHRVVLTSQDPEYIDPGAVTSLSETYCRKTVTGDGLVAVHDASATGWDADPVYDRFGIGCYLGGKVLVDGELYGTVCFVDGPGRSEPFTDVEQTFVELVVGWMGHELERRERERDLERYETIVETIDDGIYALDEDGHYTFVNDALVSMTGYDPGTLTGKHASFLTSERTQSEADRIQEILEANRATVGILETEVRTSRGTSVPVENRFAPLPGEGGRVGVVRDVTERKELERKLRGLQRTAQELTRATSERDVCRAVVEAAEEVLGHEPTGIWRAEDGSETFVDATDGDDGLSDLPVDAEVARAVLEAGDPRTVEVSGDRAGEGIRSGVLVPVGDYGLIVSVSTDPKAFVGRDVDLLQILAGNMEASLERTSRESELRETREKLRRSNAELEQFAYAASHDLREPLRMVSNYLKLLDRKYGDDLDPEAVEYIDFAVDGAERLQEMIRGLLQYSRVREDQEELHPVDLNRVVDSALLNLEVTIEERDATVTAGDLPTVRGDETQLVEVFQNLIGNAIKYTDEGSPEVEISAERRGETWRIAVADHGVGMDEEAADRAFDLFERFQHEGTEEGTGMGLAICKKVIEAHGGEIGIDSTPGEGATVSFTLPDHDGD